MGHTIRQVTAVVLQVEDRVGVLHEVLCVLRDAGVNMLAIASQRRRGMALMAIPEDLNSVRELARSRGVSLQSRQVFLIEGDDRGVVGVGLGGREPQGPAVPVGVDKAGVYASRAPFVRLPEDPGCMAQGRDRGVHVRCPAALDDARRDLAGHVGRAGAPVHEGVGDAPPVAALEGEGHDAAARGPRCGRRPRSTA